MIASDGLLEAEGRVRVVVTGPMGDVVDLRDPCEPRDEGDDDGEGAADRAFGAACRGLDECGDLLSDYDLDDRKSLGALGEEIAVRYLFACGYEIVDRNWKCRSGEADVVARDPDGEVVLVEVKTRRGALADPLESVDKRKRRKYRDIGLCYLYETRCLDCLRFDAIAVNVVDGARARLRHCIGVLSWDN